MFILQCVQLRKAETDTNTWLNEDCTSSCRPSCHRAVHDDHQQISSNGISAQDDLVTDEAKVQSSITQVGTGDRSPNKEDESQWRWRALQGGASVVRNIRKGWAHACNATLDVAAAAAELLDKSGGPLNGSGGSSETPPSRPRDPPEALPPRSDSPPSPLLMPRPGRGDSFASVGSDWEDCVVLVEHEHEPWQSRSPVTLAEWNGWFDSEGRLQVSPMLDSSNSM